MNAFFINIILAGIWLGLSSNPSPESFIIGFIVGFILISSLNPLLPENRYTHQVTGFISFAISFFKALILSNITIGYAVVFRKNKDIKPNIFTYDVSDLTTFETILLSQCITLTPGTTTIDISEDNDTLLIHGFDGENAKEQRDSITKDLKIPILRFTRQ